MQSTTTSRTNDNLIVLIWRISFESFTLPHEKNCEKVRKPKMRAKYPSAEAIPQNFVLFSSKEGAHPFVMDANVRC